MQLLAVGSKSRTLRPWPVAAAIFALVALHGVVTAPNERFLVLLPAAHADEDAAARRKRSRAVPNMQESTYRRLGEIQKLVEEKNLQKALPMLQQMLESKRRYNNNERAQIHRMIAFIYHEMEDDLNSIHHFEQVIAQVPDITEGLENSTLHTLTRFYFQEAMKYVDTPAKANEWFQKTLRTLDDWMSKVDEVGSDAHQFIATVYYQMGNNEKAIEHMEIAVRLAQERGTKVKEHWWSLLRYLYVSQNNWARAVDISEILVKDYPKRENWLSLAGAYGETDQPNKQLWTLEAAHAGGYLEQEMDFYTYAGLLLQNEVPNRASKYLQASMDQELMQRSVKNLKLLGQAYQISMDVDEAIPVFEEAGVLAEDGATLSRLASLYLQRDEYDKCRDAAQTALSKGGLRRPLTVKATLGTCVFNMHKFSEARDIFQEIRREARKSKETKSEEDLARDWLMYINSEEKRVADLAKFDM